MSQRGTWIAERSRSLSGSENSILSYVITKINLVYHNMVYIKHLWDKLNIFVIYKAFLGYIKYLLKAGGVISPVPLKREHH